MHGPASSVPDIVNEVPASSSGELIKIDLIKALILELTGKNIEVQEGLKNNENDCCQYYVCCLLKDCD